MFRLEHWPLDVHWSTSKFRQNMSHLIVTLRPTDIHTKIFPFTFYIISLSLSLSSVRSLIEFTSPLAITISTTPSWIKYIFVPIVPSLIMMSLGWKTSYFNFVTTSDTKFWSALAKKGTDATRDLQHNNEKKTSHMNKYATKCIEPQFECVSVFVHYLQL